MTDHPHPASHRYVLDKAPLIYLVCGTDGKIEEANAFAESITGDRLADRNLHDLVIDFNGTLDLDRMMQDASREHLLNIGTASGLPQSFHFFFQPHGDRVLVFGRQDAEELVHMRSELLSLNQDLSVMTRQLHKQNSQLEKLNAEKNQFLGMAAHDLRKPIGLILTYSEFLIEETAATLDGEHKGFLDTIHRSCAFMQQMVDDFLDVSAIEAGRFDLRSQPSDINSNLEQCLTIINLKADQKAVEVDISTEKELPPILIDGPKIEQVILNLVGNAIEHSKTGDKIKIDLARMADTIVFSVKDQGPGIDAKEMDRVFKPFEKTAAVKTDGEKSTGLGLLISRKIIEAHQGTIGVHSKPGSGTTFTFELPIED